MEEVNPFSLAIGYNPLHTLRVALPEQPTEESGPLCIPCPICEGSMELVYDRPTQQVCVCIDCHSGITIPATAWQVQRAKHGRKAKSDR